MHRWTSLVLHSTIKASKHDLFFQLTILPSLQGLVADLDLVALSAITNIQPVVNVGLATAEGLAVDWITNHLYWVESNLDQIEVAAFNGKQRTTLIAGRMESPRAIVVDPRYG